MGGDGRLNTDLLSNLLALDPQVHNPGPASVHGRAEWSRERGYLVPKHVDYPGLVAVVLHSGRRVILLDDGSYAP